MRRVSIAFVLSMLFISGPLISKGFSICVDANPQFRFMRNKTDCYTPAGNTKNTLDKQFLPGTSYKFARRFNDRVGVSCSRACTCYQFATKQGDQKLKYKKIPVTFIYRMDLLTPLTLVGEAGSRLTIPVSSTFCDRQGRDIVADTEYRYNCVAFENVKYAKVQFNFRYDLYLKSDALFDNNFTQGKDDKSAICNMEKVKCLK